MSNILEIPLGTRVFLGAPANPMPTESVDLLCSLLSEEQEIIEAHFPQCFIPTLMTEPRQVLFILHSQLTSIQSTVSTLTDKLPKINLINKTIDIIPLTETHPLLDEVRRTNCQIY